MRKCKRCNCEIKENKMRKCKRCNCEIEWGDYCEFCIELTEYEKMENPRTTVQRSDLI